MNDRPAYEGRIWQGHHLDGLLLNSRMVQGIFEGSRWFNIGTWIGRTELV